MRTWGILTMLGWIPRLLEESNSAEDSEETGKAPWLSLAGTVGMRGSGGGGTGGRCRLSCTSRRRGASRSGGTSRGSSACGSGGSTRGSGRTKGNGRALVGGIGGVEAARVTSADTNSDGAREGNGTSRVLQFESNTNISLKSDVPREGGCRRSREGNIRRRALLALRNDGDEVRRNATAPGKKSRLALVNAAWSVDHELSVGDSCRGKSEDRELHDY